jgi:hypothetical protein
MAVTLVASSTSAGAGTTGTAAVVMPAPALPTGTASGDRVYICTSSVGAPAAPSGWTELFNGQLGGGSMGASTGLRYCGIFYRDYDGVWSMPTVTAASVAANTIAGGAASFAKGAGEVWDTPTVTSGSDTSSNTSVSITSSTSQLVPTNGALWSVLVAPATIGTTTGITISSAGATLGGTVTLSPGAMVNTTGNDAFAVARHQSVTTGATGTQSYVATIANNRTVGAAFVAQGASTPAASLILSRVNVSNPAVTRASNW